MSAEWKYDDLIDVLFDVDVTSKEINEVFEFLQGLASTLQILLIHRRLREGNVSKGELVWRKNPSMEEPEK